MGCIHIHSKLEILNFFLLNHASLSNTAHAIQRDISELEHSSFRRKVDALSKQVPPLLFTSSMRLDPWIFKLRAF